MLILIAILRLRVSHVIYEEMTYKNAEATQKSMLLSELSLI
jgi:hypothetical protein